MFMGLWNELLLTKANEAQIYMRSLEMEMPTELSSRVKI